MQTYEAYKETGIEWIGKIPKHWKAERLRDISEYILTGSTPATNNSEYYENGSIKWFGPSSFKGNLELIDYQKLINNKAFEENELKIFPKGCIFLIGIGATIGKVGIITEDASCNQQINVLKPTSKICSKFLGYSMKVLEEIIPQIAQYTTLPIFNQTRTGFLNICLPPITEQTAIAQYLDQATEQIDKAIAIKTKQLEKLETYKKNKIHEAVTKGTKPNPKLKPSNISWIGEIPEHWKVERLKFVLTKIGSGVTPKGGSTVYQETGIPFIRSQNVYNDGFYFDEIAFISEKIHEEMKGSKVLFGDVLLNITGASIGRCFPYLSTEEANVNQHVCILRPNEKIITEFLHYLMISEIGQNQITSGFKGSGREGLNFETIKNFAITLPKKNEQKTIATYLDNFCKNIENAKENIEKQLTQLKKYRKSLIHECVTGKRKIA